MSTYAQVLLIAIPFFIGLIVLESLYGWWRGNQTFRSFDTISSISSGITNTVKNILGLTLIIVGYSWMYEHLALVHLSATFWVYAISFVLVDFAGYIHHLLSHRVNYFWNEHLIHHSSEEFNLACALRQTVSNLFSIQAFLLIPAAILGMPPKVIAIIAPLHLFLQFWYHTRHIGKLGFLEYLIVTPSQHRVHHAINPEYIDKNLGQIFPWWDRLFGTFQEELDDVPCVYGIKKPAQTWNPILINFQHLWLLIQDAWRTNDWWAKLTIWFRPTGWRPDDVKELYPIGIIKDPYSQKKYARHGSYGLHIVAWLQLLASHVFLVYMLILFEGIGSSALLLIGAFLMIHIYSYTSLMDLNPVALPTEFLKFVLGLLIIYFFGDGLKFLGSWSVGQIIFVGYLLISLITVYVLTRFELRTFGSRSQ